MAMCCSREGKNREMVGIGCLSQLRMVWDYGSGMGLNNYYVVMMKIHGVNYFNSSIKNCFIFLFILLLELIKFKFCHVFFRDFCYLLIISIFLSSILIAKMDKWSICIFKLIRCLYRY